jgi:tetratricopeptide (TPR) repeat protein
VSEQGGNDPSTVVNKVSGGSLGTSVQAGTIHGGVHVHQQAATARAVPRQLPGAPPHFTNRAAELQALDEAVAGREGKAATLVLLSGPGGVGKTALASHWGRRTAGDFPDGQLYADLGGFSTEGPVSPEQVLGGFLRALGVAPDRVPSGLAEQAALFRSLTADLRLLVLLDNAVSAAQVRPMLPASAGSTVVVSSRWRLGGLLAEGGVLVEVAALPQEHAVELLRQALGTRGNREIQQVGELASLCGHLPIALCVAGARLASRPRWPVARVVRELADEQRRLAALSTHSEVSVNTVFDLSYDSLATREARAYRWLALHPGADFGLGAAAAATGLPLQETTDALEKLVDASVLEDSGTDRYRFHDLIRLHAQQRAEAIDAQSVRDAVIERVVRYYLSFAVAADRVVMPNEWHIGPEYESSRKAAAPYQTGREALEAVEPELGNLMAVLRAASRCGLHTLVWQLCEALWPLFLYRKHFPEWIAAYQMGIHAADRCGNQLAASRMHHRLGIAFHNLSRTHDALSEGRTALEAARAAGNELAESSALQLMGMALRAGGRFDEAVAALRQAVELDRRGRQPRSEALAQRLLGQALYAAGQNDQAVEELTRACELAAMLSDPAVEAMSKVPLAEALTRGNRPALALRLAQEAWDVMRDAGSDQYRARIMMAWGQAAEALGDLEAARERLAQALAFFTAAGVPDLQPAQRALGRVRARLSGTP